MQKSTREQYNLISLLYGIVMGIPILTRIRGGLIVYLIVTFTWVILTILYYKKKRRISNMIKYAKIKGYKALGELAHHKYAGAEKTENDDTRRIIVIGAYVDEPFYYKGTVKSNGTFKLSKLLDGELDDVLKITGYKLEDLSVAKHPRVLSSELDNHKEEK